MTLIAAISLRKVVSHQILEGGVDSVVFENFLYQTITALQNDADTAEKAIVILLDNATIHKHSLIKETARQLNVTLLYNAEYSPWLNPIEQLFSYLKRKLAKQTINTK